MDLDKVWPRKLDLGETVQKLNFFLNFKENYRNSNDNFNFSFVMYILNTNTCEYNQSPK